MRVLMFKVGSLLIQLSYSLDCTLSVEAPLFINTNGDDLLAQDPVLYVSCDERPPQIKAHNSSLHQRATGAVSQGMLLSLIHSDDA